VSRFLTQPWHMPIIRPALNAAGSSFAVSVISVKFNVSQLLKSTVGASRQYELDDDIAGIDPELQIVKPLKGKVRFLRVGDAILVTGRLQTEVRVNCRRCVEPFDVPVSFKLEEQFCPSIDVSTGAPLRLEDGEDVTTRIDLHHMLDLTEVVRQNLLLALPMSPLCNELCRGLCRGCGANRNYETCTCQPEEGDPRLDVLCQLL